MDYSLPFSTWISAGSSAAEIEHLFQRQAAIDALLEGKESPEVVLDMIAEHGGDPLEYVAEVEAAVDHVVAAQLPIDNAALLLRLRE